MKNLFLILLITLATCAVFEESFDDNVVLENKKISISIPKKTYPQKTVKEILKLPIKGINGLFHGKVGEIFRKLEEVVQKGIAWLKKNDLWKNLVSILRNSGERHGLEFCKKILPEEICRPVVEFALNHALNVE